MKKSEISSVLWSEGRMTGATAALEAMHEARKDTLEREALWPKSASGRVDTQAAMSRLIRLFPTLQDAPGIEPFDGDTFLRFTCSGLSSGTYHAATFVLSVWDPTTDWNEAAHEKGILRDGERLAPFNLHDALGTWDYAHRDAFALWVHSAFWP